MNPNRWRSRAFRVTLLAGSLLCCACESNPERRYIPEEEAAQQALETALTAWKNGVTPPDMVAEGPPNIRLVDSHHKPRQKLRAFTVLGPTTGDAHRVYAVRLTFDEPREEVRTRFAVLGLDPLWVIRYDDLEMFAHWECAPPANAPKKSP